MQIEEMITMLEERRLSYIFLAQVYHKEITKDFLKQLVETDELDGILGEFKQSIIDKDLGEVEDDLAAEYAGLFLNMRTFSVSPFESVYTSTEKLLMQEARDKVLEIYRAEGLDKIKEFNEPEDHLAIELEFMAYLCQKTIDLLKKGDEETAIEYLKKQSSFLEEHLLNWVPELCNDVKKLTEHDFYRTIAELTHEFLQAEKETLEELLAEASSC